jgi:pyrrolidone-carboxylate peptidase
MIVLNNLLLWLMILVALPHCRAKRQESATQTNLGATGNADVVQKFAEYKEHHRGCVSSGAAKRVLMTGFGLFYGAEFNISGVIVDSMSSAEFWNGIFDSHNPQISSQDQSIGSGKLSRQDRGAKVVNRRVQLNGEHVDLCLLTLDVYWDLAAAIIVHEMDRFEPHVLLMTGRGGSQAIFEGGAINDATTLSGFNPDGTPAHTNEPTESPILPPSEAGVQRHIAMTWDNQSLYEHSRARIQGLGFSPTFVTAARPSNNYICNNISFVVLHAVKNISLPLAGGEVVLTPNIQTQAKIGFFHYPSSVRKTKAHIEGWASIMLGVIAQSLEL